MPDFKPQYADIALDVPLPKTFTYQVLPEMLGQVVRGSRVLVSFQRQTLVGICLGLRSELLPDELSWQNKIKPIQAVDAGDQLLNENDLKWLEEGATYYDCPIGMAIAQALPHEALSAKDFPKNSKKIAEPVGGVGDETSLPKLMPAQVEALEQMSSNQNRFGVTLIHGVTGSGKTRVYLELIRKTLAAGKSALVLVPEIGLTPQTVARLKEPFGDRLFVTHSGLTPVKRSAIWHACRKPGPWVVLGTRSALFSPLFDLGLIVIDEEHDTSYKQDDRFRYHARDLAAMRARRFDIPLVLGSATPSLEAYQQALSGRYQLVSLPERAGGGALPDISVVNATVEREQSGAPLVLSPSLHSALRETKKRGEQSILFVAQRGFAQNAFCTACKTPQSCPNCSVSLKFHLTGSKLKCHYCAFEKVYDGRCLSCQESALTLVGSGIQGVEEEVKVLHPELKMARVDSDVITKPGQFEEIFNAFQARELDVIIGTQMMAKGHDFPGVTFVGVVGLDVAMGLPDFRAGEKAFQALLQVAGRAGRSGHGAKVLVQTFSPKHPSLAFIQNHDYLGFAKAELNWREALGYPPFTRLVQIRFLANSEKSLTELFALWQPFLVKTKTAFAKQGISLLGPTEMPLAKIRGKHRYHLLVKIPRNLKGRDVAAYLLDDFRKIDAKGIDCQIDIDPLSLL